MKKKLLTMLSVVLMFSLLPALALADTTADEGGGATTKVAKIGDTEYATLAEAVAAVHEKTADERMAGTEIILMTDAQGGGFAAGYQTLTNNTTSGENPVNITIDLGWNKYTVTNPTVGSSGTETNGFQFLRGSKVTIKNGTIESALGNILFQNYSDLTMENVTVTATNASYVMSNNCGEVNITGSTSITAGTGKYAFDVCATSNYPDGVTVNVNTTGTITGNIEYGIWGSKPANNQAKLNVTNGNFEGELVVDNNLTADAKTNFVVTGGSFSDKDSFVPYLPAGNTLVENEDGKYELAPAEDSVAVIGNKGYITLKEAVEKAEPGDVITLKKNVTESLTIAENAKIILDLGEYILTNDAGKHTIEVMKGGNLTITGKGTVDNVSHQKAAIKNNLGGTVTINGGSYTRSAEASQSGEDSGDNSYYVIDNQGAMDITAGTFKFSDTNDGAFSSLIHNGWYTASQNTEEVYATMNISGGEFTQGKGGKITLKNDDWGILNIAGGEFTQPQEGYYCVLSYNEATITGGTITGAVGAWGDGQGTYEKGLLTISGDAAINGKVQARENGTVTIKGGTFTNTEFYCEADITKPGDINITGGKFPTEVIETAKEYVAPGYKISASGTVSKRSSGGSSAKSYAVIIDSVKNGDVTVSPKSAVKGTTVTVTVEPDNGYELDELTVTDANGKNVKVTEGKNGKYTFTMPDGKVTVAAEFAKIGETKPDDTTDFTDVKASAWYAEAVQYVADKGMMKGTNGYNFSPNDNTTRGQIVTVLYRLEKEPAAGTASFSDVAAGQYYAKAVAWAADKDIVKGYTEKTFGPNDNISREQIAAVLFRYAGFKGIETKADGNLTTFTDAAKVSAWAEDAMKWAVGCGLLKGDNGALNPQGNASRAEIAMMLMRFCENVAK